MYISLCQNSIHLNDTFAAEFAIRFAVLSALWSNQRCRVYTQGEATGQRPEHCLRQQALQKARQVRLSETGDMLRNCQNQLNGKISQMCWRKTINHQDKQDIIRVLDGHFLNMISSCEYCVSTSCSQDTNEFCNLVTKQNIALLSSWFPGGKIILIQRGNVLLNIFLYQQPSIVFNI